MVRVVRVSNEGVTFHVLPPKGVPNRTEVSAPPYNPKTKGVIPENFEEGELKNPPPSLVKSSDRLAVATEPSKKTEGEPPEEPAAEFIVTGKIRKGARKKEPGQESFLPLNSRR